jgi:hypothetical protein
MLFRWVIFLAAASLAGYIPFKYMTQPQAMTGLYGFLFPLSSVLATGGMLFAWRPGLVFRIPFFLRAPVGVIAAGWIGTGLLCIPSLTHSMLTSPFGGLFATFHMLAQHVVLSMALGSLVVAPRATYAHFGLPVPERPKDTVPGKLVTDAKRA